MSTPISKLQLHKLNKEEETEVKFQAMSLQSNTSTCSILEYPESDCSFTESSDVCDEIHIDSRIRPRTISIMTDSLRNSSDFSLGRSAIDGNTKVNSLKRNLDLQKPLLANNVHIHSNSVINTVSVPSYHEVDNEDYVQMHPVPLDTDDDHIHMSSFSNLTNLSISDLTDSDKHTCTYTSKDSFALHRASNSCSSLKNYTTAFASKEASHGEGNLFKLKSFGSMELLTADIVDEIPEFSLFYETLSEKSSCENSPDCLHSPVPLTKDIDSLSSLIFDIESNLSLSLSCSPIPPPEMFCDTSSPLSSLAVSPEDILSPPPIPNRLSSLFPYDDIVPDKILIQQGKRLRGLLDIVPEGTHQKSALGSMKIAVTKMLKTRRISLSKKISSSHSSNTPV